MTRGEFTVGGSPAAARRAFAAALADMGGTTGGTTGGGAPGDPARPLGFVLRRGGNIFTGTGAPYTGRARFAAAGPGRSRITVELVPRLWYSALGAAVALLVLGLLWTSAGGAGEDAAALRGVGVAFCVATAVVLHLYRRNWPQALLDELRARLGAGPDTDPAEA